MKSRAFALVINAFRFTGFAFLVFAIGCGGGGGEESGGQASSSTAGEEPAAKQASAVDPATAATLTGRVEFSGTAPEMQPIDVSSEQTCAAHAESNPLYTQNVVVNENGTLRHVFVHVKEGLEGMEFPVPSDPVVLNQIGCAYEPHVFGAQAKQPLLIKNSDEGVLHNIHSLSKKGNGFNFGMPKIMETTKAFKKAEVMVEIKCDVHGWMKAYAGVVDHPYFAVTGEDGTFKFPPLPPGDYVIESWHEEYGTQTESITVGEKESKEVTFTFQPTS